MDNSKNTPVGIAGDFAAVRPACGERSGSGMSWNFGWGILMAGFLSGAILGLGFHRADFLGGYDSFRRRLLRLGHIACCALGLLNVVVALAPVTATTRWLFVIGGLTMPVVCWLTAWRKPFRHLFFVPVMSLVAAVALVLLAGNVTKNSRGNRQAGVTVEVQRGF